MSVSKEIFLSIQTVDDIHCYSLWKQRVAKTIRSRTLIEFHQCFHTYSTKGCKNHPAENGSLIGFQKLVSILNRIIHIKCVRTNLTGDNVDDKTSWVIQSRGVKYTAINLSLDLFMSSVRCDSSLLFLTVLCSSLTFSASWCSN